MSAYNDLVARFAREDEALFADDLRSVLAMPEGRRVFQHLLEMSGFYAVLPNDAELPMRTGRRNLGVELRSKALAADAQGVLASESEAVAKARSRAELLDEAAKSDRDFNERRSMVDRILGKTERGASTWQTN